MQLDIFAILRGFFVVVDNLKVFFKQIGFDDILIAIGLTMVGWGVLTLYGLPWALIDIGGLFLLGGIYKSARG